MGLFSLFRKKDKKAAAPEVESKKAEEVVAAPVPAEPAKAPVEEPAPAKAPVEPAPAPAPAVAPAPVIEPTPAAPVEEPVEEPAEEPIEEPVAAQPDEPEEAPGQKVMGKYEFDLATDGYRFYLVANNGQLLYESIGFTTLEGAYEGIDTFRRAVLAGNFAVISDKYQRYRYVLNRKYYGENYKTRAQCEKCIESLKRFANNSAIVEFYPTEEQLAAFYTAKSAKRTVKDVDWDAVKRAEEQATKLGKFEISRGEDREFRFYLVANNGQVLYTGKNYTKLCQCLAGIESFKRAVYVGNFSVDQDKFGNFRFILRNIGVAPAFMGESYSTRKQCESSIESVKRFVVTAEIVKPEAEEKEEPATV